MVNKTNEYKMTSPLPPFPTEKLRNYRILLASASPRRRELLALILPEFSIATTREIDESYPAELAADKVPEYLAKLKSEAYTDLLTEDVILITADTVVITDGVILGKPHDPEEAKSMLNKLQGKNHIVVTGVCISDIRRSISFSEKTEVHFGELSDDEISRYVEIYRPLDKAGAYGIQEWIGAAGIKGIDGCFYNVMGLPLHSLYRELKNF